MDEKRRQDGLTWPALAALLGCSPSQLTGLRTSKFATGMDLAMRIVQRRSLAPAWALVTRSAFG